MIATLVTDGSFCDLTRAAAWAAWMESGRGRFLVGNALPGNNSGINPVEMKAATLGLSAALRRGVIVPGDHFTIQIDSTHAARRLDPGYVSSRNKKRVRRGIQPVYSSGSPAAAFRSLVAEHGLTYEVVRSREGKEIWHVDRFARWCMIEERARRQGAGEPERAAFEDVLTRARHEWVKQQPPRSAASQEALDEMAKEIGP
jgi:ribonuclease HI